MKENFDEAIVGKILNTNNKVDLSYTDYSNKTNSKTSDVSPKLKLEEIKPTVLPKAGKTSFIALVCASVVIVFVCGFKFFEIRNKMK